MKFAAALKNLKGIPHMTENQGELIYNLIQENEIFDILELGIAHGTGSCYMAASLEEKGRGSVLTIDNKTALDRVPNVHELLKKCNLEKFVTPVFANSSYNWELMKLIEKQTKNGVCEPIFDMCYLDGAHNFEIDCCAFFLVDKLLKPGGYMLFDDVTWTYENSPSLRKTEWVKKMAQDEKSTPHIKKLIELVVSNHPSYENGSLLNQWFLIRKSGVAQSSTTKAIDLNAYIVETTVRQDFKKIIKKIKRNIKKIKRNIKKK